MRLGGKKIYDAKKHTVRLAAFDELIYERKLGVEKHSATLNVRNWFNIPRSTVNAWYDNQVPQGRKGKIKFVPELSYVIGALLGDGCLYQHRPTWNHSILVGEKAFASKFSKKIYACTNTPVKEYPVRNKNVWFVKVNNHELFQLFGKIRKDAKAANSVLDNKAAAAQFIEGFFDAEGCVKVVDDKWRKTPKICLDITNTDKEILDVIQQALLKFLNIKSKYSAQKAHLGKDGHYRKKCYHLRIYKKAHIRKFFEHMSTIKINQRKKKLLEQWLNNGK